MRLNDITYAIKCLFKYPYQRMRRGYDERINWGFDTYFLNAIPPLKEFCKEQLQNKELMKLNPLRKEVFLRTLKLIKASEKMPLRDCYKQENAEQKLLVYVATNIGYYWD